MRNIILACLVILVISTIAFKGVHEYKAIRYYDGTGEITNSYVSDLKVWMGTVQPTSATFPIDISSAGFTQIKTVSIQPVKNTSDANAAPDVSIKSMTNSTITVNIKQGNGAVVSILGINVISGAPMVFSGSVADIQLIVRVTGK